MSIKPVFDKKGIFSYHDHLWPHLVGKITVANETAIANSSSYASDNSLISILSDLFVRISTRFLSLFTRYDSGVPLNSGNTETDFYKSLKVRYENIVVEKDPREAISMLQEESSMDSRTSTFCHDILHEIGRTSYQKYESFEGAVKYKSDFCNSGYVHGIFESYFESAENATSGLAEQCNKYASGGRKFDLWQCYHGVGPGFMYLTGGDLDKSLALCKESFGETPEGSCENGVFMEVFNQEVLAKENSYIDPENPFLTCSQRAIAKESCYIYVPSYLSLIRGMDYLDIFKECDNAESGYKRSCIAGVGSEAIKRNMSTPEEVFTLCNQAGTFVNQEICIAGVVGMYMNQTGSYLEGKELCKLAPNKLRRGCTVNAKSRESFFR